MDKKKNTLNFLYTFDIENKKHKEFAICLDKDSLEIIQPAKDNYPQWCKLTCQKCHNCPLNESQNEYCPIAIQTVDLIDFFTHQIGEKTVHVTIKTEERNYEKTTDLQSALSSILGIYMVTSGCPIMDKLRPMINIHLPFASHKETMYRTLSMYLLAQYFLNKHGKKSDWNMDGLRALYEDINIVNFCFMQRLKSIKVADASLNAIVQLDISGQNIAFSLEGKTNQDLLEELEGLFKSKDKNYE